MNVYEGDLNNDELELVIRLDDFKESQKVNVNAERLAFESINKVPNGLFWAYNHYNFTKGTDQTTWAIFNNKWFGWLECAQAREVLADRLGVED